MNVGMDFGEAQVLIVTRSTSGGRIDSGRVQLTTLPVMLAMASGLYP
jgi:hypothetical protein